MARILIDFPDPSIFKTPITVRVTDLNYGGHLGNDNVLSIMHEARMLFLNSLNYSEMNIEGASLIMADAGIQYKSEAFYGELLTVEIAITEITRVAFDMYYRLTCEKRLVALGKTGMLFFDYDKRKIVSCPKAFVERINALK